MKELHTYFYKNDLVVGYKSPFVDEYQNLLYQKSPNNVIEHMKDITRGLDFDLLYIKEKNIIEYIDLLLVLCKE